MNNTLYDIICNSAVLFSLWNYKTLKNPVKDRQSLGLCVCVCVREKKHERGRKHSDGSNLILCCVFILKFIYKC